MDYEIHYSFSHYSIRNILLRSGRYSRMNHLRQWIYLSNSLRCRTRSGQSHPRDNTQSHITPTQDHHPWSLLILHIGCHRLCHWSTCTRSDYHRNRAPRSTLSDPHYYFFFTEGIQITHMQDLLFQNWLLYWLSSPLSSVLISIGIMWLLWGSMLWRYYRQKPKKIQQLLTPYRVIAESDSNYTIKTLTELKEYLLARYVPHHVMAHTADEIGKYIENPELRDIMIELEHLEYSGGVLTLTERTLYNERILTALVQHP